MGRPRVVVGEAAHMATIRKDLAILAGRKAIHVSDLI